MPIHTVVRLVCMKDLPAEAIEQVASYFQALAEPSRLKILNLLREGEASVGEIAARCGSSVANVSRHLTLLGQRGLVARETRGNSAYYRIADPSIYQLCDLVCGNLARRFERTLAERAAFAGGAPSQDSVGVEPVG
jgi:DNA-binding transcriptional ArsR family regulator